MASESIKEANPAPSMDAAQEMAKYGIARVPVDYFHYKQYRYLNLEDAVAQAQIDQERAATHTGDAKKQ